MEVQRRGRERLGTQQYEVGRWRRARGHWMSACALLTLVATLVVAPVTQASATPQAQSPATAILSTSGSFVTSPSNGTTNGLTTANATLHHAGDLLVIWVKSRFNVAGQIQITGIAASGAGAIGTPVKAIQYFTVDHPNNDDEIWYVPVVTTGATTLTFTWSGSTSPSDFDEYSTQEFEPSTASTYSVEGTNTYESNSSSSTMTFPTLTPVGANELYAGYNSNNSTGMYTTPTSSGYSANASADNDAIIFGPQVSTLTQSPYTTMTIAASAQSSIGALIVATPIYYNVTFIGNGSTSGTMNAESDNTSTPLTTNAFIRTGYTFSGWNTLANGSGTSYADGATYPFTAALTLYAQWTPDVTFNGNGSTSGTMNIETANIATALTVNTYTRTGYNFAGWNTLANGSGTSYADGATYPFTVALTLYAQWTADYYNVTFIGNGSTSGTMNAESDNTSTPLTTNAFIRTGYTFSGWNTVADGSGTGYAEGATYPFTAALTLYAQWTADYYNVTFKGNGSTSGAMNTESANTATALATNTFVKTGSTFSGWNTATNGSGASYAGGAKYAFTSAVTLYAQWTADTFKVKFSGNGSTSEAMKVESANVPKALINNTFVRTGYIFTGWSTSANGKGTKYANRARFAFNKSVTLYAQWRAVVPHALRIIGSVIVGHSRLVTIVGTGFFKGLHVKSNERGTAVRVLKAGVTELLLTVTVGKGSPLGRHTFTIVTASKKTCTINYMTRK